MDTLSSMANIAGYKGVLLAAVELNRYFPMLMTAAGMVFPAKVFVIGAGVAGLQAIATARRLGANVVATDVRPEVKEQIESVGAKYVGIELKESAAAGGGYAKELSDEDRRRQSELLAEECAQSDVVITTALIGGVFAPRLITADTVRTMKPGSVIVDLAADGGGNCELSKPGETVHVGGVTILAPLNLPATMPFHASLLFSRNLTAFVLAFTKDKAFQLDFTDDIQQGALITHDGEVRHARTRDALAEGAMRRLGRRESDFWPTLYVFVLATFIGLGVIRRVSRLLHTPLMSLTNAISAIAVVGAILVTGGDYPLRIRILGAIALFASTTNIVSGFLITDRMLKMFKTGKSDAKAGGGHS